jgi:hypothetical protein
VNPGLAASVHARLFARTKERGEDFWLKGALLFDLWFDVPHRPTRDADFLGFGPQDAAVLGDAVRIICNIQADDGMVFETGSIAIEEIREDTRYGGLRARLVGLLGKARSTCRMTL